MEINRMTALYITIPLAMILAVFALIIFLISMKNGQYDDIEAAKYRILFDEEFPKKKKDSNG
jgi:cbb3-type cytochrome oxidase maturation protein